MSVTDYKLKFLIEADARSAKRAFEETTADARRFSNTMTSAFGTAIPLAGALASGIAVAGAGLLTLAKTAAEFGSEIYDASQKTGLSATALSAMKAAADQSGASLEAVTKGVAKFAKQYKGDSGDLQTELGKVFKQIADAKPGFEQLTLAQKNFGKGGADLIPFIRSFDGDVNKLIKTMSELGITIDDKAAYEADQFGDQMDILDAQLAGVGRTIGTAVMPQLTAMASEFSNFIKDNKSEIAEWGNTTSNILRGVAAYWRDAGNAVRYYMGGRSDTESRSGLTMPSGSDFMAAMFPVFAIGRGLANKGAAEPQPYGPYAYEMSPGGTKAGDTVTTGGGGKRIRPKVESDSEFRKFFDELGFSVVRTYGKAINAGSPHTYGGAADLSIRGKSPDEIFMLMVRSLEKGYRVFDERKPAPGVKQTGPHVHVENAKTSLMKESRFLQMGFTGDQVAYLKQLDQQRLGKATGKGGLDSFIAKNLEEQKKAEDDYLDYVEDALQTMLQNERTAMNERLDLRKGEANLAEEILRGQLDQGLITEQEYADRVGQLRIDMLQDERDELAEQISTRENIHKIAMLDLEIAAEKLKKENDIAAALKRQREEWDAMQGGLRKANRRPGGMKTREAGGSIFDDMDAATGKVRTFQDVIGGLGNMASDIFMQMGQGLGQMLSAWVMMGDQADVSMSKMVASVFAGVAAQAATLSVFHLAMGIVALTPWGAAMYGPAANHFIAAAMWGGVAAGAAVGGRLLAGNPNKSGASGSSYGGGSYSGSGSSQQANTSPLSRASASAFYSGRDMTTDRLASAVEGLERKINGMRPGDVLTAGAREKRGFIGETVAKEIKSNASIGRDILRTAGAR